MKGDKKNPLLDTGLSGMDHWYSFHNHFQSAWRKKFGDITEKDPRYIIYTLFPRIHRHAVICAKPRFLGMPLYGVQIIKKTKISPFRIQRHAVRPTQNIFHCPNWPKFELFGLLFKFKELNFSFFFAYYNRQIWYLLSIRWYFTNLW